MMKFLPYIQMLRGNAVLTTYTAYVSKSFGDHLSSCRNTIWKEHRVPKVSVLPGTNVLGGVTLKVLAPDVHILLTNLFSADDEPVPLGSITTFYRLQLKGTVLYSHQYQRVKKRNSYTISYHDVHGKIWCSC